MKGVVFCSGTKKRLLNFLLLPESEQQTLQAQELLLNSTV